MIGKAARRDRRREAAIGQYVAAFHLGWEPPHYASHGIPCDACGAAWQTMADGSGSMDHALDCTLMAALDRACPCPVCT